MKKLFKLFKFIAQLFTVSDKEAKAMGLVKASQRNEYNDAQKAKQCHTCNK